MEGISNSLIIDGKVLDTIEAIDTKLEQIGNTANVMSKDVNDAFLVVVQQGINMEAQLDKIIEKLSNLGNGGRGVRNVSDSFKDMSNAMTDAANNLNKFQNIGVFAGDSSKLYSEWVHIQAEMLRAEQRMQELVSYTEQYKSSVSKAREEGTNIIRPTYEGKSYQQINEEIAALQQEIDAYKVLQKEIVAKGQAQGQSVALAKSLESDATQQVSWSDAKSRYEYELLVEQYKNGTSELQKQAKAEDDKAKADAKAAKEAEKAAAAAQKAAEAQQKANEKAIRDAEKLAAAQQKAAEAEKIAYNKTYEGSMSFSSNANNVNDNVEAIKYLKSARDSLNKTDSDYAKKLATLNSEISKNEMAVRMARGESERLANSHRNLLNISGQLAYGLAAMFSVSAIKGYITEMVAVRGEFELQKRSLEALLQNKSKADVLFNRTVELAIKSPFRIKELITYTKQLAAYRVESNKLYDTNKMLADISAGLGVEMDRLILAYGQVKAANYLRGQELRQFSEAGINILGELANRFTEINGRVVSTGEVFDMVSKRMVKFEDVDAVLKKMTEDGGIFYNMQEIQSETLKGKLANLKDSFDIMFNAIGEANEGTLKNAVDALKRFVDNWQEVSIYIKEVVVALLSYKAVMKLTTIAQSKMSEVMGATTIGFGKFKNESLTSMLALKRTSDAAKGASATSFLLAKGVASLESAFLGLSQVLVSSIPIAILMVVVGAITKIVAEKKALKEHINEINTAYLEQKKVVLDLSDAYNKLGSSSADDNKRIELVQELIDKYEELGAKIPVRLDGEGDSEYFKRLLNGYDGLIDKINEYSLTFARMDKNGLFVKGLGKNIGKLSSEFNDLKSKTNDALIAITWLRDNYDSLNKNIQDCVDSISDFNGEAERMPEVSSKLGTIFGFYMSGHDKMEMLSSKGFDFYKTFTNQGNRYYESLSRVNSLLDDFTQKIALLSKEQLSDDLPALIIAFNEQESMKNLDSALKDIVNKELYMDILVRLTGIDYSRTVLEKFISDMKTKYKDDIQGNFNNIKVDFDRFAAQANMDSLTKELSRKIIYIKLGFRLNEQNNAVEKPLEGLRKRLQDYIDANGLTWDGFVKIKQDQSWDEYFDGLRDKAESLKKRIEKLKKATQNITEGSTNEAEIKEDTKQYNAIMKLLNAFGEAETKIGRGGSGKTSIEEIWGKRLNLLSTINTEYEKLLKNYDKDAAARKIAESYSGSFKEAFNLDISKLEGQFDTKSIISFAERYKSEFQKSISNMKIFDGWKVKVGVDIQEKGLDSIESTVKDMFDMYDIVKKAQDMGLSKSQTKTIFGADYIDLNGLRSYLDSVTSEFNNFGESGVASLAKFTGQLKSLTDKETEEQVRAFAKALENQFDDYGKLYGKYIKERDALINNPDIPDETKNLALGQLTKGFEEEVSKIDWKEFMNSDYYVMFFNNLENMSNETLDGMIEKLESMKESLKNLPPDQIKAITEAINKIKTEKFEKGYVSLKSIFELMRNGGGGSKEAMERLNDALKKQAELTAKIRKNEEQQQDLSNAGVAEDDDSMIALKKELDNLRKQKRTIDDIVENEQKRVDINHKIAGTISKMFDAANEMLSSVSEGWGDFKDNFSEGAQNGIDNTVKALSGVFSMGSGVAKLYAGNYIGGIKDIIKGVSTEIALAFEMYDSQIVKDMDKIKDRLEALGNEIKRLQEKYSDSTGIDDMVSSYKQILKDMKEEYKSYNRLAQADQRRKKGKQDLDQQQEWKDAAEQAIRDAKDLRVEFLQSLGGLGDADTYKSQTESFVDAWLDAFKETGDGLSGLEDSFNDMITNILKKEVSLKILNYYLKDVFDMVDASLEDDGAMTEAEMQAILDMWNSRKGLINQELLDWNTMLSNFGLDIDSSTGELSSLQQGIQSVSEDTALALESMLNSMRFYVADSNTVLHRIQDILEGQYGGSSQPTPMYMEMQHQTAIMANMESYFSSVMKGGHPEGGQGIKVFMD